MFTTPIAMNSGRSALPMTRCDPDRRAAGGVDVVGGLTTGSLALAGEP